MINILKFTEEKMYIHVGLLKSRIYVQGVLHHCKQKKPPRRSSMNSTMISDTSRAIFESPQKLCSNTRLLITEIQEVGVTVHNQCKQYCFH